MEWEQRALRAEAVTKSVGRGLRNTQNELESYQAWVRQNELESYQAWVRVNGPAGGDVLPETSESQPVHGVAWSGVWRGVAWCGTL